MIPMPKVFDEAGFAGRFYMADLNEPVHIHVVKDNKEAKFWVTPIALATNSGFSQRELRRVEELIRKYQADIRTFWQAAEEARRNAGRTS